MQNEEICKSDCQVCVGRVAWVGIWANLAMVVMKLFVGYISGSKSCIADALHSFSNIITAFAILLSQKLSRKTRTDEFPFGYGKIEFVVAGFISLFIISAAISLITLSLKHLLSGPSTPPHFMAVLAAVISILVNEMLFRFMRCVGTRFKSQSIMASAWSNRTDCFSSVAVIIGVVGTRLGIPHLDPICALIVVIIIVKVSADILLDSIKALMDTSLNSTYGAEIKGVLARMEEVKGLTNLKTRHIGQKVWAEVDITIDAKCTMKEGEAIAEQVRLTLRKHIHDLERVMVFTAPAES